MKIKCRACKAAFDDEEAECPRCGTSKNPVEPIKRAAFQDGPRVAPPKQCMAHGCPLSGTFNPIIMGDSPTWQCFIHAELPGPVWQHATAAINRHLPEFRSIPDDYAFRAAVRDAVAGKEVSRKYWQADGITRNAYLDAIRAARKA